MDETGLVSHIRKPWAEMERRCKRLAENDSDVRDAAQKRPRDDF